MGRMLFTGLLLLCGPGFVLGQKPETPDNPKYDDAGSTIRMALASFTWEGKSPRSWAIWQQIGWIGRSGKKRKTPRN